MSDTAQDHPEYFKPTPEEESALSAGFVGALGATDTEPVDTKPVKTSNRVTGALVALLGGAVFAILFAVAAWAYSFAAWAYGSGEAGTEMAAFIENRTLAFLATPVYWLTSIAFTLYFILLAIVINKGHWRTFVLLGLLVALLTYATAVGAGLFTVHAWTLTFPEALDFMWRAIAFNPLILVAVVLSREIPIWFGGWIALKGRKLRDPAPVVESVETPADVTP